MSEKFRDRYRIKSARAPWWDYGQGGSYFITICTKNRQHYFGEITDGKMQLSNIGIIANLMWYEIKNHAKDCQLGEFVVMPDHVHGVLIFNGNGSLVGSQSQIVESPIVESSIVESSIVESSIVESSIVESSIVESSIVESSIVESSIVESPIVETRHALSLQLGIQPDPIQPDPIQPDPIQPDPIQPDPIQPDPKKLSPAQSRFQNQGKNTISSIVGSYKSAVTKHAHRLGFEFAWQARFHDHIIRDDAQMERISDYIRRNIENWEDGNHLDERGFE